MAAEYLREIKESLETTDSETFRDIFFDYKKASLPECLNRAFEGVSELAEFIIVVEETESLDGLKEIMTNLTDETGVNLLIDSEGREPDIEAMPMSYFKKALIHRFDTDNLDAVKDGIIGDFLMPMILENLISTARNECSLGSHESELIKSAGWM